MAERYPDAHQLVCEELAEARRCRHCGEARRDHYMGILRGCRQGRTRFEELLNRSRDNA